MGSGRAAILNSDTFIHQEDESAWDVEISGY